MCVGNKLCCSEHFAATDREGEERLNVRIENISPVQTTEALDSVKERDSPALFKESQVYCKTSRYFGPPTL